MMIGGFTGLACYLLTQLPGAGKSSVVIGLLYLLCLSAFNFLLISKNESANEGLKRDVLLSVVPALIISLLAIWMIRPGNGSGVIFAFNLSMIIALYCSMVFIQTWKETENFSFPYPLLFQYGWNNGFIVMLAMAFTLAFALLLLIWAGLFKLIDISLFQNIFKEKVFVLTVGFAAFATGLSLARENIKVIEMFRRLTFSFIKGLLPLLAFIGILFALTLLFTGLDLLFSTLSATGLMLTVVVLAVWFINGLYQDGQLNAPYPSAVRFLVQGLLLVLPVYSFIAIYAMLLRIDQYGLMPDRIYGIVVAFKLCLYSLGYAAAVLFATDRWMKKLEKVNVYIACLIIAFALLLHSPVLDVTRLSVNNQLSRLQSGKVSAADFDYAALQFKLGKAGKAGLDELLSETEHADYRVIVKNIEKVRKAKNYYHATKGSKGRKVVEQLAILDNMQYWPKGFVLDEAERQAIASGMLWGDRSACKNISCSLLAINLDDEPDMEYVLLTNRSKINNFNVYKVTGNKSSARTLRMAKGESVSYLSLISLIEKQQIQAVVSPLKDLKIGDNQFAARNYR